MMNHNEAEVLQRSPDRSVVQMPDGRGAELCSYTAFYFHFLLHPVRERFKIKDVLAQLLSPHEQ